MAKGLLSSKKGQGMSLNTVIIAIIVLVVLVVLVMIFTGYFGKVFTPAVQNCETTLAGKCQKTCGEGEGVIAKYAKKDDAARGGCTTTDEPSYCCKPKLGTGF